MVADAYSLPPADAGRYGEWRRVTGVAKAQRVAHALRDLPAEGVALLDVGCGDGVILVELGARRPGWTLAGVDVSPAAVRIAAARLPGIRIEEYDGARLPWPDGAFDVGVLSHVLEHVDDPVATLRETARVCRLVVVEVPLEHNVSAARRSKRAQAREIGHVSRFSRREVRALLRAAGLEPGEEITATLSRAAHRFFADGPGRRLRADAKWLAQRVLHACVPPLAMRLFTVQYLVVVAPRA